MSECDRIPKIEGMPVVWKCGKTPLPRLISGSEYALNLGVPESYGSDDIDAIEPNIWGIQGNMHTLSAVYVNTMMYG